MTLTSTNSFPGEIPIVAGGNINNSAAYFVESPEITAKIVAFTKEMFQSEVEVSREYDPEGAEEPYVIFRVATRGSTEEILAKELAWTRKLIEMAPGWNTYTLSIWPIP